MIVTVLYGSFYIALCLFCSFGITLVEILLTSGKTYLKLDLAVFEIAFGRNQCQTVFLGLGIKSDYLLFMH